MMELLLKPGPGPRTQTPDADPRPGPWTLDPDSGPNPGPWTRTLKNMGNS